MFSKETLRAFIRDLTIYIQKKLSLFGRVFETHKDILVDLLMAKRGRYQGSFLNLSVFMLATSGIIAAPHISAYYPTLVQGEVLSTVAPPSATVADLELEHMAMVTRESDKPRDQVIEYTVKSGDTLSGIARTFDVSEESIQWANDLKGKNPVLKPDQTLQIPPVTGVVHKVKRGDTVFSIAKTYETDAQNIVNYPFNDFVDLDTFTLAVGQVLIVPGGIVKEKERKLELFSPLFSDYIRGKITERAINGEFFLTKKEHMLFELLKKHKDQVCERDTIIDTVWHEYEEIGVSDWAVDRLVARLRKKMAVMKSEFLIQTVKTRGFILVNKKS